MEITVKELHSLPLVTIQFWVHVGSRNEPDEYRGIAHIFEHMWFKGTPTQPTGSFDRKVESLGGELNAMTSNDWTTYFVTLPSDKFDEIFPLMVDLLLNPLFDNTEVEKEKQVIIEEQRFSFNEPEKYTDDQFAQILIDEHPYRHPVIGYKSTISATTREEIIKFYQTWYVPNNMNIVIVGDVKKEHVIPKVKSAFEKLAPKELPRLELPIQKPITVPRYNSSFRTLGYTYVEFGFLAPSSKDKDRYAMDVLQTILAVGDSSRLELTVKKQKNLIVRGISSFAALNDFGVLAILAVVEPEKATSAKAEVLYQLNRFKTEYVTDEELERAKTIILANKLKSREEMFQVAFDIGQSWIDGDVNEHEQFANRINSVTKEDIKKAAQQYLVAYTMYELKPTP